MSQVYTTIETFSPDGQSLGVEIIDTVTDLDAFKRQEKAAVDAAFSAAVSADLAVDQARRLKLDEALEVIALEADRGEIRIDDFPMLKASLNVGEAPIAGARRIRDAFRAARADLARKEGIRLRVKAAIDKAASAAEVAQVRASLDWTAP